jgi:hypothetical protein
VQQDIELQNLLSELLTAAKTMHVHHERLLPFGAAVFMDGEVKIAGASLEDVNAPVEAYESAITEGFSTQATQGKIRAVGWIVDLQIIRDEVETDALRIRLEHAEGGVAQLYLPYVRRVHGCEYGELFRVEAEPRIFAVRTSGS